MSLFGRNLDDIVKLSVDNFNVVVESPEAKSAKLNLDKSFEKIIKGQVTYQSTNIGCNLLSMRMQKAYASQPTQTQLESCLREMKAFFSKYHSVLTEDEEKISKL
jgi:hypothetical protein